MDGIKKLTLAKKIDWRGVRRIGVILIHNDGYCKWIGLGVTGEKGNLTSIGGEYEPTKDNNIFETAIREYKEELGNNYPLIDDMKIWNSWAIQDHIIVNIFHPVDEMLLNFDKTDEIQSLVWLTPKQLLEIKKHKPFRMSYWIKTMIDDICNCVNSGEPFMICKNKIIPPHCLNFHDEKNRVCTSYDNFKNDILSYTGVTPICCVCTDKKNFAVRTKRKTYILDKNYFNDAMNHINNIKIGIMVPGDREYFKSACSGIYVYTLHDVAFRKNIDSIRNKTIALYQEYILLLRAIKPKPKGTHLIDQLDLLEKYELKIYFLNKENKKINDDKNFVIYRIINCVNYELSLKPLPIENIQSILHRRYWIDIDDIKENFDILFNKIIVYDQKTGLCYIKY